MPRTMASDSSRSLTKTRTALSCELTSTFQIRFRASWSCMNTVVAPRSNRTEPITTESASFSRSFAFRSTVRTTAAPSSPTRARISVTTRPSTSGRWKTRPATATTINTRGATESSV